MMIVYAAPLRKISTLSCSLFVLMHGLAQASTTHNMQDDYVAVPGALPMHFDNQIPRKSDLTEMIASDTFNPGRLRSSVSSDALENQRGHGADGVTVQVAQAGKSTQGQGDNDPAGKAEEKGRGKPDVTQIFDQQGVLTPSGTVVLEPSVQYSYSSSNRVALVGYTIVPALLVGLIDIREVKRNTVTAALSGRLGITNRFELEARVPYVYRYDSTVSREVGAGSSTDRVFNTRGDDVGDAEVGARYQLNVGGIDRPYYIGTLRYKSRTGTDPFEVVTDCAVRCVDNTSGTGLPLDLPTGSGFQSLQAGLTWLLPSDPAVFFGSFTYLHNFKRTDVSRRVLAGNTEFLGTIEPGGIFGFNFGMGLAMNDKSSFSLGYDHNSVGRTKLNGQVVPGSVYTQLGTLLIGYSYRLSEKRTLNVSVGAGLTRDTQDLTLNVKMPISF